MNRSNFLKSLLALPFSLKALATTLSKEPPPPKATTLPVLTDEEMDLAWNGGSSPYIVALHGTTKCEVGEAVSLDAMGRILPAKNRDTAVGLVIGYAGDNVLVRIK